MMGFKKWYENNCGYQYPGHEFEFTTDVIQRVMDKIPEYLDYALKEKFMGEGHGIGWAIKQLNNRERVRRMGWNGKGMWLELQVPDEHSKMSLPYIYIEYPEGHAAYPDGCRVPWLASQTDILATDWELAR